MADNTFKNRLDTFLNDNTSNQLDYKDYFKDLDWAQEYTRASALSPIEPSSPFYQPVVDWVGDFLNPEPPNIEDEDRLRRMRGEATDEHEWARTKYAWYEKFHSGANFMFNTASVVDKWAKKEYPTFFQQRNYYESKLEHLLTLLKTEKNIRLTPTSGQNIFGLIELAAAYNGINLTEGIPNPIYKIHELGEDILGIPNVDPYADQSNRNVAFPSTPPFDKYREDYQAWRHLSGKEQARVYTQHRLELLKRKANQLGLNPYEVNEVGALKAQDLSEFLSWGLALADPLMAVPLTPATKAVGLAGQGLRKEAAKNVIQGMAMGGVLTGIDNSMYQAAQKGAESIDPLEVGIAVGLGAAFVGMLSAGGYAFKKFMHWKWGNEQPTTKEEVSDKIKDLVTAGGPDLSRYTDDITLALNRNAEDLKLLPNGIAKQGSRDMDLWVMKQDLARSVVDETLKKVEMENPVVIGDMVAVLIRKIMSGEISAADDAVLGSKIAKEMLAKGFRTMATRAERDAFAKKYGFNSAMDMAEHMYNGWRRRSDINVINHYRKTMNESKKAKAKAFDRVASEVDKDIDVRPKDIERGFKALERETKTQRILSAAAHKRAKNIRVNPITKEEGRIVKDLEAEARVLYDQEGKEIFNKLKRAAKLAKDSEKDRVQPRFRGQPGGKEAGAISPATSMAMQAAFPITGALIGMTDDDNPIAHAIGGAFLGTLPLIAARMVGARLNRQPFLFSGGDRLKQALIPLEITGAARWLPMIPEWGNLLYQGIRKADNFANRETAGTMGRLGRAANESNINLASSKQLEKSEHIVKALRRQELPKDEVKKFVKEMEKVFNELLKLVYNSGLISRDTFEAVKVHRAVNGFFPLVMDEGNLSTKPMRKFWMKHFTTGNFDKESLVKVVDSLSDLAYLEEVTKKVKWQKGVRSGTRTEIVNVKTVSPRHMNVWKDDQGRIRANLTEDGAKELYLHRRSNPFAIMHSMETEKLIADDDFLTILEPFTSKDIAGVTENYLQSVLTRIGFAKQFGPDDRIANGIFKEIVANVNKDYELAAKEIYYASKHSIKSKNVKATVERNTGLWDSVEGKTMAFQTLLLSMAGFLNYMQAPFLGSVYLMKIGHGKGRWGNNIIANSISRPYTVFSDVIANTYKMHKSKNRMEILESSGSAMHFSTMAALGDMNSRVHSIAGRKFTGMLSPIEKINNPTQYLRLFKFLQIEELQRAIASGLGEAAAYDLARQKIKLEKQGKTNSGYYRDILIWMNELGMDTTTKLSDIAEIRADQLRRSGDIFETQLNMSTEVNFSNTPLYQPMLLQHPSAKLVRQFNSYIIHFSAAVLKNVIKPAIGLRRDLVSGKNIWGAPNLWPLATFIGVGAVLGSTMWEIITGVKRGLAIPWMTYEGDIESMEDVWDHMYTDHDFYFGLPEHVRKQGLYEGAVEWLLSDDEELSGTQAMIKWYGLFGGLGKWVNIATGAVEEGPAGVGQEIAGPAINRAVEFSYDLWKEKTANPYAPIYHPEHWKNWEDVNYNKLGYEAARGTFGPFSKALMPPYSEIED